MATARKPFVRLETSLVREPWDHDLKGTLCLLMCMMGDRWARDRLTAEEAAKITLSPGQMSDITGRTHLRHARDRLLCLARHVSMKVTTQGRHTTVEWPRWPITQELASRGREFKARAKPESAPAPSQAQASKDSVDASASQSTAPKPARSRKPPPRPWALELADHLIEHLSKVPGARIPPRARTSWARHIEQMPNEIPELKLIVMQGGSSALVERIQAGIEDATGPDAMRSEDREVRQFSPQIRCGKSLLAKWDQITAAAARRKPQNLSPEEFARRVAEVH